MTHDGCLFPHRLYGLRKAHSFQITCDLVSGGKEDSLFFINRLNRIQKKVNIGLHVISFCVHNTGNFSYNLTCLAEELSECHIRCISKTDIRLASALVPAGHGS